MTGDDMSRKFDPDSETNSSRRKFLKTLGAATAGVLLTPYIKSAGVLAYGYEKKAVYLAQVAITNGSVAASLSSPMRYAPMLSTATGCFPANNT